MITIPGGGRTEGPYGMLVLSLVLIGLAITLEPIPLTAFILILASKGGVRKGAAFIFGWLRSSGSAHPALALSRPVQGPDSAPVRAGWFGLRTPTRLTIRRGGVALTTSGREKYCARSLDEI